MTFPEWTQFQTRVLEFEVQGLVTRTFRRLDPQRQQAVVQAILDEAGEKGPAAINIKQVAGRAGVSVGSLYQYFGNRDGLMAFAVALCVRYMTDMFAESRPYLVAMPLREALAAYLSYGIEWGATQVGLIRFFGRAAYQGDPNLAEGVVRPVAVAMRDLTRDILLAARERGELRSDLDLEAAARLVNLWLIALGDSQMLPYLNIYYQVVDEAVPFERVLKGLLDLLEHGLLEGTKGPAHAPF
ncbi:MAG: TetR/AcrR family transcriptional regulator [Anaerolineales bacterium]|nr:TetR/AcrR family transcriptional regulator [Anaerolineales bacterium]